MQEHTDPRWLRAILARERVHHRTLAAASGLSEQTVSGFLTGRLRLGELGTIKLHRGLTDLGLPTSPDDDSREVKRA